MNLEIKRAKKAPIMFVSGPNGQILQFQSVDDEGTLSEADYMDWKDKILKGEDHIKNPQDYETVAIISTIQAAMMLNLPKLEESDLWRLDMRQGVTAVSDSVIKDLKG